MIPSAMVTSGGTSLRNVGNAFWSDSRGDDEDGEICIKNQIDYTY